MTDTVEVRCPQCNRFLAEVSSYGRVMCKDCGWQVEVTSRETRKKAAVKA